jgi:hypothetical protein
MQIHVPNGGGKAVVRGYQEQFMLAKRESRRKAVGAGRSSSTLTWLTGHNTEKVGNYTYSQAMTVIEIFCVHTVGQARAHLDPLPSLNDLVLSKSFPLHLSFIRQGSVWFLFDSESSPSYMRAVKPTTVRCQEFRQIVSMSLSWTVH